MGLELIFGKPHLSDGENTIARKAKYKPRRGFWSWLFSLFSSMASLWRVIFVRRELFIRNANQTKRIVFEKGVQVQLAFVGLGLVLWLAYATSGVLLGKSSNKIMQERLAETHNAYEAKISDLQKEYQELNLRVFLAEKEFSKISDELTKRHNHLTNLIGMQERIGKKIKKRSNISKKTKRSKSGKQGILKPLRRHDNVLLASRPAGTIYQNFPAIKTSFANSATINKMMTGNKKIDKIAAHIIAIDQEQRAILDHIEENIALRLENYHRAFTQTEAVKADVFVERVALNDKNDYNDAPQTNPTNIGGPFVAIAAPRNTTAHEKSLRKTNSSFIVPQTGTNPYKISLQTRAQIYQLEENIKSLAALDNAIVYLPLAQPMRTYYITSAFGPRIDPFTREWAFHTGIDIAGSDDRVQATLPGKVSFAGTARGYGKMVEIDHGFGVKTRYGHLKKISVRKGSDVQFKQLIGFMGDTGRSTGEHLHYEILFNDKPHDAWKFIEAGKNVFKAAQ